MNKSKEIALIQGINTILLYQLLKFHIFRKVHTVLLSILQSTM